MNSTALAVARTYLGTEEIDGRVHNARIVAMLQEILPWVTSDEVPWCSAFAFEVTLRLGLPRPLQHPERARSWLTVGQAVDLHEARAENDIVILSRGQELHPGPDPTLGPGHVGFFVERVPGEVALLGGNQRDAVSIQRFPIAHIIGVRRLE